MYMYSNKSKYIPIISFSRGYERDNFDKWLITHAKGFADVNNYLYNRLDGYYSIRGYETEFYKTVDIFLLKRRITSQKILGNE